MATNGGRLAVDWPSDGRQRRVPAQAWTYMSPFGLAKISLRPRYEEQSSDARIRGAAHGHVGTRGGGFDVAAARRWQTMPSPLVISCSLPSDARAHPPPRRSQPCRSRPSNGQSRHHRSGQLKRRENFSLHDLCCWAYTGRARVFRRRASIYRPISRELRSLVQLCWRYRFSRRAHSTLSQTRSFGRTAAVAHTGPLEQLLRR